MAGKRRGTPRKRALSGKKKRKKLPQKPRGKSRSRAYIPVNPYAELSGEQIRAVLSAIGNILPTDERSRQYQVLLGGKEKLKKSKRPRFSLEERRYLAAERRKILTSKEEVPPVLAQFNRNEVKLARRKTTGRDLATEAEEILRKRGTKDQMVFWIPNDRETGLYKKWQSFENFELFVRRPYYKDALEKEMANGRFVIGTYDPETHTIREDAAGNPIIDKELRGYAGRRGKRKK